MPSSSYYRRQADICLRLALTHEDIETVSQLLAKAREYAAKAETEAAMEPHPDVLTQPWWRRADSAAG